MTEFTDSDYYKMMYQKNKTHILKYNLDNKDKLKEYRTNYNKKNIEARKENYKNNKKYIECITCNTKYVSTNGNKHLLTKKHLNNLKNI